MLHKLTQSDELGRSSPMSTSLAQRCMNTAFVVLMTTLYINVANAQADPDTPPFGTRFIWQSDPVNGFDQTLSMVSVS
jgi:hypothetical protein